MMYKCKFAHVDELREFLNATDFEEVKFCVDPDYIDAVIGLTDEGKVVYDYDLMVEHLSNIYKSEDCIDDPYESACEWVDYNCDMPYWEIIHKLEENNYDFIMECKDFEERFSDYKNSIIGINHYGCLLIDSEYVNNQNIDDIETILKEEDVMYKIV